MMRVSIELGFSFKKDLCEDYRVLELPEGADVEAAVRMLALRHPAAQPRLLDGAGHVRSHVAALINGGNVAWKDGLRTPLHDGDRLTLLPPVGGG
ncbi:MAG: MoaD/ThiS family protein [Candidatus Bipolaricaulis sp.]|nr:MoaD/ThiS family protein [Candidatus Bipolaricaulis sp.]